jgi:YVTN family beta-propeller protein
MRISRLVAVAVTLLAAGAAQAAGPRAIGPATTARPHAIAGGFDLPNGWRITPAAQNLGSTGDLVMKMVTAPDGRAVIAVNSGYLPHGLTVIDPKSRKIVQRIPMASTWLGLAWSPDGKTLYVSGGNNAGSKTQAKAPIYAFSYAAGRLSAQPVAQFDETWAMDKVGWAGVAHHPTKPLLYAANRGVGMDATPVVVFDANTHALVARIAVDVSPYELVFSKDGSRLYVSNWSSRTVSVIDTALNKTIGTIPVGSNPNDMVLGADGRLYVACSGDNTVHVIDTRTGAVVEKISTTLHPRAPEGATPDALALDRARSLLYVANADNNDVAVIDVKKPGRSEVKGFVPVGWYPSALAIAEKGGALYIGAGKGEAAYPTPHGPHAPGGAKESIKSLQVSTLERLPLAGLAKRLPALTRQAVANSPYRDELLTQARAPAAPSVVPRAVGAGSPIQHVIYVIRENRTYDQVLGDLGRGDGDPSLALFGRKITPNAHALSEQFVTLDNLYADGEVSVDGHSWSNAAYASDYNEKTWPSNYADRSDVKPAPAYYAPAGYSWDLARRKGLTYRNYGEFGRRVSTGDTMQPAPGADGLWGHLNSDYIGFNARDRDNLAVFLKEFDAYEANFDSPDAGKRLPNLVVMSMGEDHTRGAQAGAFTPVAMVADNDWAVGQLVERVSHSKYWASTAIMIIEDDAQDGADHVDARRTVGLVISPYIRRGTVDSTLYSTSSFLRTMELLLGLPPMSQYDAAANPLYAAFGDKPDLTPYVGKPAEVDLFAKNTSRTPGADESAKMDFSEPDRAPMRKLNEIIWKAVNGPDAKVPAPTHRFRALADAAPDDDD